MPNASNLHSNTVWKTRFSKLLSSLLWIVTVWAEKKKKYAKNRKWWDKLNVAFLHWRCCLQKFSKEGAIYDWRTCVKLCSWLEVYAEGPLSLYAANCSQPCTKERPPLFLTTSRIPFSSMLFTLHEFTRFLTSPLFRWEINPFIVGIALSENKKIMDGLKFLFSFLGFG